jgi:hypothetical protein
LAPKGRERFSRIGVAFGMMAATLITADYFIQLRVVQPAILRGELDGLAPLTQYNPHGVFIALEDAAYLLTTGPRGMVVRGSVAPEHLARN